MNKRVLLSACTLAVSSIIMATPAIAIDASPNPSLFPGQTIRQQMAIGRQTIRTDRSKAHAARLSRRFAFYASRLTNIGTRIQSSIDKKTALGKDTSAAQAQLKTANTLLNSAISDGQQAVIMFNTITLDKWDVQKPEVKAAIAQAQKARKEFVQARQGMLNAVKILKTIK